MVRRGLAPSREQARQLVAAGSVLVQGAPVDKASRMVDPGDALVVVDRPRFVSRGGDKLDPALDAFAIVVAGRRCLDAGASTGGFTDALLQRGAASVWAVDVGRNQLHERIRSDQRVVVREGWNLRAVGPEDTEGAFDVVVADLSFISVRLVAASLRSLTRSDGDLVVLVKPQFEAGRREASRGRGVIRDASIHRRVLDEVISDMAERRMRAQGVERSSLTGGDGNVEFLVHFRHGTADDAVVTDVTLDDVVEQG